MNGMNELIERLQAHEELLWVNEEALRTPAATGLELVGLDAADIRKAADRLQRFAPYLAQVFPELEKTFGIIESPLVGAPNMSGHGPLWLKLDSHLPISGSIKARGGIYEVLHHAEAIANRLGLVIPSALETAREVFSRHTVSVGSTGNLGMSIGIMAATLGFNAVVHMSADAREWKKERLRNHGVTVVEHSGDFSVAVDAGRREAENDPSTHFVDDENSETLFLGYAVAGVRLAGQLRAMDIRPTAKNPLIVYLPCGVGGGPGGVTFGLKTELGDAVRCIFVEPTHSPAMLLGVATGLHNEISVADIGLDNVTAADGLAVGRPSGFVGKRMRLLVDAYATVSDARLFELIRELDAKEGIRIEPSAAAGLVGPARVAAAPGYWEAVGFEQPCAHLAWLTGGSMVPAEEMDAYLAS